MDWSYFVTALLLVTREAIRNAVQHASPRAIEVRLALTPLGLQLDVTDDGVGFDPECNGFAAEGHFGILGMRERMEQIGGSFEIVSRKGGGTVITAQLPAKTLAIFC